MDSKVVKVDPSEDKEVRVGRMDKVDPLTRTARIKDSLDRVTLRLKDSVEIKPDIKKIDILPLQLYPIPKRGCI